jgi:hypothetical protein
MYSERRNQYFELRPGRNTIDVVVPSLPLADGTYAATVAIYPPESSEEIDFFRRAKYFLVHKDKETPGGGFIKIEDGPVIVQHHWVFHHPSKKDFTD